ncbi:hypothetical protein EYF80_034469 [Liparis tanakae]|uniref:Uncharacterized protein n=1 Tax=Liparis tanakae TaxID=230148 RepID=A0A4Z2GP57_9TELE|nr:hypothetical protein EYF80_034469 [Liparis tanakae]
METEEWLRAAEGNQELGVAEGRGDKMYLFHLVGPQRSTGVSMWSECEPAEVFSGVSLCPDSSQISDVCSNGETAPIQIVVMPFSLVGVPTEGLNGLRFVLKSSLSPREHIPPTPPPPHPTHPHPSETVPAHFKVGLWEYGALLRASGRTAVLSGCDGLVFPADLVCQTPKEGELRKKVSRSKILLGALKWNGPREGLVFILFRRKARYFTVEG